MLPLAKGRKLAGMAFGMLADAQQALLHVESEWSEIAGALQHGEHRVGHRILVIF